jgi:CRP-like cAMP-binding protein
MKEKFKNLIRHIIVIDEHQLDKIAAYFKPISVKRNTILLLENDVCKKFYYVGKGSFRTYFIDKQGHEKTRFLVFDCSIGTALTSFINQKPSFEIIEVLEDSELLEITYKDFFQLLLDIPEWAVFYRKILEMAYTYQNEKIQSRVTLSAKQRYDKILKETPFYVNRLSNKVLASYLDITQETLSRLKSK